MSACKTTFQSGPKCWTSQPRDRTTDRFCEATFLPQKNPLKITLCRVESDAFNIQQHLRSKSNSMFKLFYPILGCWEPTGSHPAWFPHCWNRLKRKGGVLYVLYGKLAPNGVTNPRRQCSYSRYFGFLPPLAGSAAAARGSPWTHTVLLRWQSAEKVIITLPTFTYQRLDNILFTFCSIRFLIVICRGAPPFTLVSDHAGRSAQ